MKKITLSIILLFSLGCSSVDEKKLLVDELYLYIGDSKYIKSNDIEAIYFAIQTSFHREELKKEVEDRLSNFDTILFHQTTFFEYFYNTFSKEELEDILKFVKSPLFSKFFNSYNYFNQEYFPFKNSDRLIDSLKGTKYSKIYIDKLPSLFIDNVLIIGVKYVKRDKNVFEVYDMNDKKYSFKNYNGNALNYNFGEENRKGFLNVNKGIIDEYYFK